MVNLNKISFLIADRLNINIKGVKNVMSLLDDGATVPFISRYRKEMTNSLDELDVQNIKLAYAEYLDLNKRKEFIIKTIDDQNKLTDQLKKLIHDCWDSTRLEDIYLPFKKKKKTKGTIAREKGLEPLAKIICRQETKNLILEANRFLNNEVKGVDDALEGARHIISEWVNENAKVRTALRNIFSKSAVVVSKLVKKKELEAEKYTDYFDFNEPLKKIPSHRLLAIFRAEKEGLLRVALQIDELHAKEKIRHYYTDKYNKCAAQIDLAIEDALKRLTIPSIENEFRKSVKELADKEAIDVFAENLRQLLLAPPLGEKNILAIDPGFKSGCKLVCIDNKGALVTNTNIYPHPPQMRVDESISKIHSLISKFKIEAIAIGNGTAGRETMALLKSQKLKPDLFLVNESGASIYSASEIAREEFADYDLTVRGAVSIGRRLMDPLAELVKIDPKSIGVGQYQHDVNQTKLKDKLSAVVEFCVNSVGINLNTASKHLLTYVSGLGPTLAQNIVDYRSEKGAFKTRRDLLNVPRMGAKAYQQAAGFLRIKNAKNVLDNTAVHPESYSTVKKMAKDIKVTVNALVDNKDLKSQIDLNKYVNEKIGLPTLKDIIIELEKPGLDPRGIAKTFHFTSGIHAIEDLKEEMIVNGLVNNLTKFGAFVDIGIKESGLIHISQIVDRFIKDPAEVLKLNQKVKVKIIAIDKQRKRISLSMKNL